MPRIAFPVLADGLLVDVVIGLDGGTFPPERSASQSFWTPGIASPWISGPPSFCKRTSSLKA
jgi:hypothetical protein